MKSQTLLGVSVAAGVLALATTLSVGAAPKSNASQPSSAKHGASKPKATPASNRGKVGPANPDDRKMRRRVKHSVYVPCYAFDTIFTVRKPNWTKWGEADSGCFVRRDGKVSLIAPVNLPSTAGRSWVTGIRCEVKNSSKKTDLHFKAWFERRGKNPFVTVEFNGDAPASGKVEKRTSGKKRMLDPVNEVYSLRVNYELTRPEGAMSAEDNHFDGCRVDFTIEE